MKKLIFIVFIGTFSFLTLSSKETTAFESTYQPGNSGDILIENARILTGTGNEILRGSILISSNKIKAKYKVSFNLCNKAETCCV